MYIFAPGFEGPGLKGSGIFQVRCLDDMVLVKRFEEVMEQHQIARRATQLSNALWIDQPAQVLGGSISVGVGVVGGGGGGDDVLAIGKVNAGIKCGKHNHHTQYPHDRSNSTSGNCVEVKHVKNDHRHHRATNGGYKGINSRPQK